MAKIRPFRCVRPTEEVASRVAALPYDVYNREEAKRETEREPLSFLSIDRAETWFPDSVGTYDACVYEKAREVLNRRIKDGIFLMEEEPCYYLYELTRSGHIQTGIVACSSVDDYLNGVIKKHENTRADKEQDRICHVDVTNAQTGPIFLAYRARHALRELCAGVRAQEKTIYDFTAPDRVRHRVFRISEPDQIRLITEEMEAVPSTYIADGHHRAASAIRVAQMRREQHPDYDGSEEFNYFLSILFPDEELSILPYNRAVADLNGLSQDAFLERVQEHFRITGRMTTVMAGEGKGGRLPQKKGEFCMLLDDIWYRVEVREEIRTEDPVRGLDVSLLQDYLLNPVLGIEDPRTSSRIAFIGGVRGTKELERRVHNDMRVAFSMYPTSLAELFAVADAGRLMPPKSTWFEPKPRSGLFIHFLE